MILDRFVKVFQVQTSKTFNEIKNEIAFRSERQQKNKLLVLSEPINYKEICITEDSIIIDRKSTVYNRLKGVGLITLNLESNHNGTLITCIVDPTLQKMLKDIMFILISLIIITVMVLKDINEIYISTILFVAITWIFGFLVGYFSLSFNTKNLESYSYLILKDLGLIS